MLLKTSKYCLFVRQDLADLQPGLFEADELYGMKSDLYMYKDLKEYLSTKNIDLNTQNVNSPTESDVILCLNETGFFENYQRTPANKKLALILTEPPVYNEKDWSGERHRIFDTVFTYNSGLVKKNPARYVKIVYPIDLSAKAAFKLPSASDFDKKKLAVIVASSFTIESPEKNLNSLLTERYRVLKWFNRNAPNLLDHYSRTNPLKNFSHFRGAALTNKINPRMTRLIARYLYRKNNSRIYKGAIESLDKNRVLASYKFNFCFENSEIKGYITEKIFDCFFSHTVPVYYGAPDIDEYIPGNCFIRFKDFKNMQELQQFLSGMNYEDYLQYLENAKSFLNSPASAKFNSMIFSQTIYDTCTHEH